MFLKQFPMDIEMNEEGKGPVRIFQLVPATMEGMVLPTASPVVIGSKTFTGLLQEFKGKGYSAWYNRFWTKGPVIIQTRADFPVLELRIGLLNKISGTWEKILQPALPLHNFSMSFTPHVLTRAIFDQENEYQTFDIHFELTFLESLGFEYNSLNAFIEKVFKKKPAELGKRPFRCPGPMMDAVNAILENDFSNNGKSYLLDCKIREILLLALETIGKDETALPMALKPADIGKLETVKELIAEALPDYPGNDALCRSTGLNEFKLTIGFKYLFEKTPYDYHMELKMKLGKQLLKKQEHNVEGVAFLLGYDGASAFIKEFRKLFKYTPGWFKKNGGY